MPTETRGASGQMTLSHHWHEESSGYNDETTTTEELRASEDGSRVLLVRTTETSTLSGETCRSKIYSISVRALIEWIQREGESTT